MSESRVPEEIQDEILAQLETVIDPELGIDIVNLGLVYAIDLDENGVCKVDMTLTTIGCPLADIIINDITNALNRVEAVKEVQVELVWYPAWTPERMSRYARIALGVKI